MDDYLSLRSLEGNGRSLGTERPSSSLPRLEQNEASRGRDRRSQAEERPSQRSIGSRPAPETDRAARPRSERNEFQRELDHARDRDREDRRPTGPSQPSRDEIAGPAHEVESASAEPAEPGDAARARSESRPSEPERSEATPEPTEPTAGELAEPIPLLPPPGTAPQTAELPATPSAAPSTTAAPAPLIPATSAAPELARPGEASLQSPTEGTSTEVGVAPAAGATTDAGLGARNSGAHTGGESAAHSELAAASGKTVAAEGSDAKGFRVELAEPRAEARPADVELAGSILRQFRLQLQPQLDSAVMQLHPAELGRIAIRVEVKDGKLRAVMRAERAETLNVLERHLPELRATLENAGLEAQSFDLGLGFESNEDGAPSFADRASDSLNPNTDEPSSASALERRLARAIVSESAVDTYA